MLNSTAGQQQTVLELEVPTLVTLLAEHIDKRIVVVRMEDLQNQVGGYRRSVFYLKDSIGFVGPGDLAGGRPPKKASRRTHPRCLRQQSLAPPQIFFDQFSRRYVRGESDHPEGLSLVVKKHLPIRRQPVGGTVRPNHAEL